MTISLIVARLIVSVLLFVCVVLSFLPRFAADRLAGLQKNLTETIERRRAELERG